MDNMQLYSQLADRLNAIPGGFARTQSGVELRILEKLFTPEQAEMANVMRLRCESVENIASRIKLAPDVVKAMLKGMLRDGLIRVEYGKNGPGYGLIPFVVGIYEMNLHRMDTELATLLESYVRETGSSNPLYEKPSVHRVIPVEESLSLDIEIHSHESATALLEDAKSWGVRDCICRVQKNLIGEGCEHPLEVCLVFSPLEDAFDKMPVTRVITKSEALSILQKAREAGLVHTTGNYRDGHNYVCNCCTCACGILRGLTEFKIPTAIAHSDFLAVVDEDLCAGCGDCVDRCQFDAISVPEGAAVVDPMRCLGCGQCASICSTEAMRIERRPRRDRESIPANIIGWMLRRGKKRGRALLEVL